MHTGLYADKSVSHSLVLMTAITLHFMTNEDHKNNKFANSPQRRSRSILAQSTLSPAYSTRAPDANDIATSVTEQQTDNKSWKQTLKRVSVGPLQHDAHPNADQEQIVLPPAKDLAIAIDDDDSCHMSISRKSGADDHEN